jgi:hypothetical protein
MEPGVNISRKKPSIIYCENCIKASWFYHEEGMSIRTSRAHTVCSEFLDTSIVFHARQHPQVRIQQARSAFDTLKSLDTFCILI